MKGSHWRKSHLGVYNGLTGLNLMPCKHIFGSQIEKNMLDQSEMVLLFSLLFSYVVATSKAITSDSSLFSAWLLDEPKLRYSVNQREFTTFVWRKVGLGILRGFSIPRPQYRFGNLVSSLNALNMCWKELSGYKGNIPFYLHGCCSCYLLPLAQAGDNWTSMFFK